MALFRPFGASVPYPLREAGVALNDTFVAPQLPLPTGGAGTAASPWTHSDGTGGLKTALTAAQTTGKAVHVPAGHYSLTATWNGFYTGARVTTEPGVVLVCDPALPGGLAVEVAGTAGTYLEWVQLGGMRLTRTGAGSVRLQYVRRSQVGVITGSGTGGGLLSVRDIDRVQLAGVIGSGLGASGSALFALRCTYLQVGPILADGGQEAVDLFEVHHSHFSKVTSVDAADEGIDMGSCTYNHFDEVTVINPANSGVSVKVEDGGTSGGSFRNVFGKVTVTGHSLRGFDIANSPATPNGTDVNNDNLVGQLTVISSVSGAVGVRFASGTVNPQMTGNRLHQFHVVVPGKAIHSSDQVDCIIEDGYAESTGAIGVHVEGTSDSRLNTRPRVRRVRAKGGTSINDGAFVFGRCVDFDFDDLYVVTSGGIGVMLDRVRRGRVTDCSVNDCQQHGISLNVRDEANWRGSIHVAIKRNRVKNVGLGSSNRYGLRIVQAGATTCETVQVDDNDVFDTAGTPTTNGLLWSGTFDRCTDRNNALRTTELVSTRSGSAGASGVTTGTLT